jgi:hypothetical protein
MIRPLLLSLSLLACAEVAVGQAPAPSKSAVEAEIDWTRARELHRRASSGEKLNAEDQAYLDRARAARAKGEVGRAAGGKSNPAAGKESFGFKPLTEMTADDRYKDMDGGLYGKGRNTPPEGHAKAAAAALSAIKPLDADGKPASDGKIGFISISMSNATQEFSTFVPIADADPAKSPKLQIVDCAQGGQAMAEWVDPQARAWQTTDQRLRSADLSPNQVQIVWIKLANKSPQGDLQRHGRKLQRDTEAVIHNAMAKFPNLKIAYLSSRIYGGWSGGSLNPEPYAYEGAFVVRWLIDDQIAGNAELNYDPKRGDVKAPLLLWGPYLWADGVVPRKSDGLTYSRDDLGPDGTHPSAQGREKVARQLLDFFKNDPLASSWFRGTGKTSSK